MEPITKKKKDTSLSSKSDTAFRQTMATNRVSQNPWAATLAVAVAWTIVLVLPGRLAAQSFDFGGAEFNAVRQITLPSGKKYAIVVTQFFHHGEISSDGKNVAVLTGDKKGVPARVLQLGPGDYCRLAFQTLGSQRSYEVYYGGTPPEPTEVPAWTSNAGLLLETRRYRQCNLNSLESVRAAFEAASPFGSDYVANIHHSYNPFSLKPEPFLSRYSGVLHVPSDGRYGFFTSSQDCSFLLIDGKVVVDAPGRHRALRRATSGTRKDVRLSAGPHTLEYYHAASGPEASMVAAWEVSPTKDPKPRPAAIPSDAFRAQVVGRVNAGNVATRTERLVPDFLLRIVGDVPLPENDQALIGVKFTNASPTVLSLKSRVEWDFGDGQKSAVPEPVHVYLYPGIYTVKLTVYRAGKPFAITNRVQIDRPILTRKNTLHELDDYLAILETYDPRSLDAAGLCQLARTYQWKADNILAGPKPRDENEDENENKDKGKANKKDQTSSTAEPEKPWEPPDPKQLRQLREARREEALPYIDAAVALGKAALVEESAAEGDSALIRLARLVGPMARNQLGDPRLAGQIWQGASKKISREEFKAECELAAADIAMSDMLNPNAGKMFLDAATARLQKNATGPIASRLKRTWGDYHALTGDGEAARKLYAEAESALGSTRSHIQRTAWRGAHNRSTEEFLETGELDRAAAEIHAWQREFPADKIDGTLTLLYAKYWARRDRHEQAISLCEQLLTVNPDAPSIDQLLLLAADSEVKRGRVDRALATLHSLLTDYPGSPLVPVVKKNIAVLEAGETPARP